MLGIVLLCTGDIMLGPGGKTIIAVVYWGPTGLWIQGEDRER